MSAELSADTKAILLLTAPLIAGRQAPSVNPLGAAAYRRLAHRLVALHRRPADLLTREAPDLLKECAPGTERDRLERLLGRGFLLGQAIERWQVRAIRVVSRADDAYPRRLKTRLEENAPPVLYGCGDPGILDAGGLAVVGSRNADQELLDYAEAVGRLAAAAGCVVISGGARGIDRAAMTGALDASGRAVGVLADSLERAAMNRENREALMDGRLLLVSPYDPAARFHVGHAMQRNKLIYALSDAALVVNADRGKGGTWAGAIEQLDRLKLVPVHVRADGEAGAGLEALRGHGARIWPDPDTPEAFAEILDAPPETTHAVPAQPTLLTDIREEPASFAGEEPETVLKPRNDAEPAAGEWFLEVRERIERMDAPTTPAGIADALKVPKKQAEGWLRRYIDARIGELLRDPQACMTEAEIADTLGFPPGRVRYALRRLVGSGVIGKLSGRPARYGSGGFFNRRG